VRTLDSFSAAKPLVPEFDFCLGPGTGTSSAAPGTTYMVFVHEWTQIIDGTMAYMPLSKDLGSSPAGLRPIERLPWTDLYFWTAMRSSISIDVIMSPLKTCIAGTTGWYPLSMTHWIKLPHAFPISSIGPL
jgi:hypothetical protein